MSRLVDRLLERVAPKATASAGCDTIKFCSQSILYARQCCVGKGCRTWVVGACG
ncbi:hypothetical protein GWI34_30950 [Actinomadura sp. DSM 109109]|nr:hypothetical protein [Actinomadura lepetitiana]